MNKLLRNNYINAILTIILLAGVALIIIPSSFLMVKWGANHALKILFTYLGLGFLFLFLGQKRLMFISLFGAAILAMYLNSMTNSEMKAPKQREDAPIVKLAHFNTQNYNPEDELDTVLSTLISTEADLLSVQETTPYWDSILVAKFKKDYPYHFIQADLGLSGMSLFSKQPFVNVDTVHFEDVPNIVGSIMMSETDTLHFIGSHTLPALNYVSYEKLLKHLDFIADYCLKTSTPMLTFGDYHAVPWSNEIAKLRNKAALKDSRRGFTPTFPHGSQTIFEVPIDHIFFSENLECLHFSTISSAYSTHLGILGTFQIKIQDDNYQNAEKKN